jgi:hypothetical protein
LLCGPGRSQRQHEHVLQVPVPSFCFPPPLLCLRPLCDDETPNNKPKGGCVCARTRAGKRVFLSSRLLGSFFVRHLACVEREREIVRDRAGPLGHCDRHDRVEQSWMGSWVAWVVDIVEHPFQHSTFILPANDQTTHSALLIYKKNTNKRIIIIVLTQASVFCPTGTRSHRFPPASELVSTDFPGNNQGNTLESSFTLFIWSRSECFFLLGARYDKKSIKYPDEKKLDPTDLASCYDFDRKEFERTSRINTYQIPRPSGSRLDDHHHHLPLCNLEESAHHVSHTPQVNENTDTP